MSAPETREAVVCLPVLPLQLLWKRRPAWRGTPVAVVEDDSPEAPLVLLSREARRRGLRPGLRQGTARSLVPGLRTGVVSASDLEAWQRELAEALTTFSPKVEPAPELAGSFFVDPEGLERLYGGHDNWSRMVAGYLEGRGLVASVVVGFRRFRALAIARGHRGALVLKTPADERERSDQVTLRHLGFPERLCDPLAMLGVKTLGAFLALPAGELTTRFGRQAAELQARFSDTRQLPMQPAAFEAPRRVTMPVQPATHHLERLLFATKGALDRLLRDLRERGEQLTQLRLTFRLEKHGRRLGASSGRAGGPGSGGAGGAASSRAASSRAASSRAASSRAVRGIAPGAQASDFPGGLDRGEGGSKPASSIPKRPSTKHAEQFCLSESEREHVETIEPAAPVTDAATLLELVRLRLSRLALPAPVEELTVEAEGVTGHAGRAMYLATEPPSSSGRELGASPLRPPRDLEAGERALARVRATFGEASVVQARLREAHLPEARFRYEPLRTLRRPTLRRPTLRRSPHRGAEHHEAPSPIFSTGTTFPDRRPPLQRRVRARPLALPTTPSGGPKLECLFEGAGKVLALEGPRRLSGGWWGRHRGLERDYFYAETAGGGVFWVFWDRPRQKWFLQGQLD